MNNVVAETFRRAAKVFVKKTCGHYLQEELKTSQIEFNLSRRTFTVETLRLNADKLNEHFMDLPFAVKSVRINKATGALKPDLENASKVDLDGIHIVLVPRAQAPQVSPHYQWGLESGQHGAQSINPRGADSDLHFTTHQNRSASSKYMPRPGLEGEKSINELIDQLVRMLENVQIRNVRIDIEHKTQDNKTVIISVRIPSLEYSDVTGQSTDSPLVRNDSNVAASPSRNPSVLVKSIKLRSIQIQLTEKQEEGEEEVKDDKKEKEKEGDKERKRRKGREVTRTVLVLGFAVHNDDDESSTSKSRDRSRKGKNMRNRRRDESSNEDASDSEDGSSDDKKSQRKSRARRRRDTPATSEDDDSDDTQDNKEDETDSQYDVVLLRIRRVPTIGVPATDIECNMRHLRFIGTPADLALLQDFANAFSSSAVSSALQKDAGETSDSKGLSLSPPANMDVVFEEEPARKVDYRQKSPQVTRQVSIGLVQHELDTSVSSGVHINSGSSERSLRKSGAGVLTTNPTEFHSIDDYDELSALTEESDSEDDEDDDDVTDDEYQDARESIEGEHDNVKHSIDAYSPNDKTGGHKEEKVVHARPEAVEFKFKLVCQTGSLTLLYESKEVSARAFAPSVASRVTINSGAKNGRDEAFHQMLPCEHMTCEFSTLTVDHAASQVKHQSVLSFGNLDVLEYLYDSQPANEKQKKKKTVKPSKQNQYVQNKLLQFFPAELFDGSPIGSPLPSPRASHDRNAGPTSVKPDVRCTFVHRELGKLVYGKGSEGSDTSVHVSLRSACLYYDSNLMDRLTTLLSVLSKSEGTPQPGATQRKSSSDQDEDRLPPGDEIAHSIIAPSNKRIQGASTHITVDVEKMLCVGIKFRDANSGKFRDETLVLSFCDQPKITTHLHNDQTEMLLSVDFGQLTASLHKEPHTTLNHHSAQKLFFDAHMRSTRGDLVTPLEVLIRNDNWRPYHHIPVPVHQLPMDDINYDEEEQDYTYQSGSFQDFFSLFKKHGRATAEADLLNYSKCVVHFRLPSSRIGINKSEYDQIVELFASSISSSAPPDQKNAQVHDTPKRTPRNIWEHPAHTLALKVSCTGGNWVLSDDTPTNAADNDRPLARHCELEFSGLELLQLVGYQGTDRHFTLFTGNDVTIHDTISHKNTSRVVTRIRPAPKDSQMLRVLAASLPTETVTKIKLNGFTVHHKKGLNWLMQVISFFQPKSPAQVEVKMDKGKEKEKLGSGSDEDEFERQIQELKRRQKEARLKKNADKGKDKVGTSLAKPDESANSKPSRLIVVVTGMELEYIPTLLSSRACVVIDKIVYKLGGEPLEAGIEGQSLLKLRGLFVYIIGDSGHPSRWTKEINPANVKQHPRIAHRFKHYAGSGYVQIATLDFITASIVNYANNVDKSLPATQIDIKSDSTAPTFKVSLCSDSCKILKDIIADYTTDENLAGPAEPIIVFHDGRPAGGKNNILLTLDNNAFGVAPPQPETKKKGRKDRRGPARSNSDQFAGNREPIKFMPPPKTRLVIQEDYMGDNNNVGSARDSGKYRDEPDIAVRGPPQATAKTPAKKAVPSGRAALKQSTDSGPEFETRAFELDDDDISDDSSDEDLGSPDLPLPRKVIKTQPPVRGGLIDDSDSDSESDSEPEIAKSQPNLRDTRNTGGIANTGRRSSQPQAKPKPRIAAEPKVHKLFLEQGFTGLSDCIIEEFIRLPVTTAGEVLLCVPNGYPRSTMRVICHNFTVVIRVCDGTDIEQAPPSLACSPASSTFENEYAGPSLAAGGISPSLFDDASPKPCRNENVSMEMHLTGIRAQYDELEPGQQYARRIALALRDFEMEDHIATSVFSHLLTYDSDIAREPDACMLSLELECVRPDLKQPTIEEWRARAKVLPLRLYIDQDVIEFLSRFSESLPKNPVIPDAPETLYFQSFALDAIRVKVDYQPKPGLKNLQTVAVESVRPKPNKDAATTDAGPSAAVALALSIPIRAATLKLNPAKVKGLGFGEIGARLGASYLPDFIDTQLYQLAQSVSPIRSILNIGSGVSDLFYTPYQQWQKQGNVLAGVREGSRSAARKIGGELLNVGTAVASGATYVLQSADYYIGAGESPTNVYDEQPEDAKEGVQFAAAAVSREINNAANRLVYAPMEEYNSGGGALGTMGAIVAGVPAAPLRLMIGVTDGVAKTLIGATQYVDPSLKSEMNKMYKRRQSGPLSPTSASAQQRKSKRGAVGEGESEAREGDEAREGEEGEEGEGEEDGEGEVFSPEDEYDGNGSVYADDDDENSEDDLYSPRNSE